MKVAAFDIGVEEFSGSESDLDVFDFLLTADKAMSMPALPEDEMRYSITQLVADVVRNAGYDGITFRSSIAAGLNLCLFSPEDLTFVDGSSIAAKVTKLAYTLDNAALVDPSQPNEYYSLDQH